MNKSRTPEARRAQRLKYRDRIRAYNLAYSKWYSRTQHGYTKNLWKRINTRTINGYYSDPYKDNAVSYFRKGIRVELTYEELAEAVARSWHIIEEIWQRGGVATIDRINNDGHYSPDNIRFVTSVENVRNKSGKVLVGINHTKPPTKDEFDNIDRLIHRTKRNLKR